MGRQSITGGVTPKGRHRIQFDLRIEGVRYRPSLRWVPSEANLRRARDTLRRIKAQIEAGIFRFSEEFPDYPLGKTGHLSLNAQTCTDVFDAFLRHEAARVVRGDLAPVTLASHRQILDHVWRPHVGPLPFLGIRHSMLVKIADAHPWNKKTYNNAISALRRAFDFGYRDHPEQRDPAAVLRSARICKKDRPPIDPFSIQDAQVLITALHRDWGEAQGNYDEFRFFTGLRPSEEIALVVSDYDAAHGVLSITKARVQGIDKDVTKTGNDRRIELCPRAITVLERQLRLRERLVKTGRIDHECLFFTQTGEPIRDLVYPYSRWRRTLQRLAIRYRKPYAARHSSVSWDLMLGRNPLWVAKQHGHSIATMLWVYAAWIEGTSETDLHTLQEAMNGVRQSSPAEPASPPTGSLTDYGISTSHPGTASAALAAAPALPRTPDGPTRVDAAAGLDPDANSSRELGTGLVTGPKEATGKSLSLRKKSWRRGWDSKRSSYRNQQVTDSPKGPYPPPSPQIPPFATGFATKRSAGGQVHVKKARERSTSRLRGNPAGVRSRRRALEGRRPVRSRRA